MYLQLLDLGETTIYGISYNFRHQYYLSEATLFSKYESENIIASSVLPFTILKFLNYEQ
jgi:hypothetical protein